MDTARKSPGFLHLLPLKGGGEWLHMCIRHKETSTYLMDEVALDDLIVDALMEEDTRSRLRVRDEGIMVLLKAMHLRGEEMARPEDMISMRLWLTPDRVISTREADVDPILEIAARLAKGEGPVTSGDFLGDLVEEHLDEVEAQVEMIEDDTAQIAQLIGNLELEFACRNMADTETRISGFLRHLGPQRPVLETLSTLRHPVLDDRGRARLDDGLNRLLRLLETLQSLRDQIAILNDQVSRIQDRRLNRSSYVFAAAATIFLPLGFVTGMFGVNLMGLPLEDSPQGFWILTAICLGLSVGLLALFRWRKWL
ncbi:CorA family divalent cation transporter [Tabrizicola sp. M-4]|uniref:CorA family divalent cation transporter n=1 Tax=Tabrizicola sp. M-4 TaxID=3055847 RepID=UPI003DA89499